MDNEKQDCGPEKELVIDISYDAQAFANRLKECRKAQKLSQEKLAEEVGVVHSTVWKWEKGIAIPRGIYLDKLSSILHVDLNSLLTRKISSSGKAAEIASLTSFSQETIEKIMDGRVPPAVIYAVEKFLSSEQIVDMAAKSLGKLLPQIFNEKGQWVGEHVDIKTLDDYITKTAFAGNSDLRKVIVQCILWLFPKKSDEVTNSQNDDLLNKS